MLNRSLSAACSAGAEATGAVRDEDERDEDERDGAAAGAGAAENVWAGAAELVEPENTCWPADDVTPLPALLPPPVDVLPPERAGGFVRSAEAGASLRATLGVLNPGALFADSAVGADAAGVLGAAAAGAGAGAATENEAGAKPPVGRDAVIV